MSTRFHDPIKKYYGYRIRTHKKNYNAQLNTEGQSETKKNAIKQILQ